MKLSLPVVAVVSLIAAASLSLVGIGAGASLTDSVANNPTITEGNVQLQVIGAWVFDAYNGPSTYVWHGSDISSDHKSVNFHMTGQKADLDLNFYIRVKNTGTVPIRYESLTITGNDNNSMGRGLYVWSWVWDGSFKGLKPLDVVNSDGTGARLVPTESAGEGNAGTEWHVLQPNQTRDYDFEVATDWYDLGNQPLPPNAHDESVNPTLTIVGTDTLKTPPSPSAAAPVNGSPKGITKLPAPPSL